jgi:hypothetical protein
MAGDIDTTLVEEIGEPWFSSNSCCLGHGNPSRSTEFALAVDDDHGNAPDGFVFIIDAECEPVALVHTDRADAFLAVLNRGMDARISGVYIPNQMTPKASQAWRAFMDAGLLWWINRGLHVFGWAIEVLCEPNGDPIEATPRRGVTYRGFPRESEEEGYEKLSKHLAENAAGTHEVVEW